MDTRPTSQKIAHRTIAGFGIATLAMLAIPALLIVAIIIGLAFYLAGDAYKQAGNEANSQTSNQTRR